MQRGPRFPIAHALYFRKVAVALQAHMPAVHQEIMIWGVKGESPPFCLAKSFIFLTLKGMQIFKIVGKPLLGEK